MARSPFFRATPAAIACLVGFLLVAGATVAIFPLVDSVNSAILQGVVDLRTSGLNALYAVVTQFGGTIVITALTAVVAVVLLWKKRYNDALFILLTVVLTAAFAQLFKYAILEPRPPLATMLVGVDDPSFPSGHSTVSFALYASLAAVGCSLLPGKSRTWVRALIVAAAVILIALVGTSRIYLGAHWTSDVLGGWLLAGAVFASSYDAWKRGRFEAFLAKLSSATPKK